jgi:hypothetical protein
MHLIPRRPVVRLRWTLCLCASVPLCLTAVAGEASFSAKPIASKDGDKTKITFTVSAPTDVEVAVLDSAGKVVRHLAAGVLGGKNPPPEPLKPGLAQTLEWDGKDDAGNPPPSTVHPPPFRVRVRAGMSVKFGRIIGANPNTGELGYGGNGVATAPDGTLYLKMAANTGFHTEFPWQLRRFDKSGKYQKTLLPYAPSTPPDKVPGFRLIDAGDGLLTPAQRSGLYPVLYSFGDSIHGRVVDGSVIFVANSTARLTFFKVDGSNAAKTVAMRSAPDKLKWSDWLTPQLAFSPDGKYAYYSNVAGVPYPSAKKPADVDPKFPQGRIYRQDLTKPGSDPEKFYDLELPDWEKTKYWLPSNHCARTAAAGIDVDANGNLLICDLVNWDVVEVSPEGKKLSATKVPWPDKVLVSAKTGALYVLSCSVSESAPSFRPGAASILKVTGRGADAKIVAKLSIKGIPPDSMALDDSGAAPALWLGGGAQLVRVEDRGAEFVDAGGSVLNADKDAIDFVCYGDVDAESEQVYITSGTGKVWRYNGETGEGGRAPIGGVDLAVGPGGNIYSWSGWHGHVMRYTRDFKPLPVASTGKNSYEASFVEGRMGRGQSVPGMDVDGQGRVYAMIDRDGPSHVIVHDADGKLVDFERKAPQEKGKPETVPGAASIPVLIDGLRRIDSCVRLDPAGNVYLMRYGLAKGHLPPKGFEKEDSYRGATGTIYKFGPKGGAFPKGDYGAPLPTPAAVGALGAYSAACGPISGAWASTGSCCTCARPRFDVDAYGRLYIPNGMTFKVTLLDNSDNLILSFGGYGNWDAQGPKSGSTSSPPDALSPSKGAEPKPEIPLGWPVFAGASDKYVYVGDALNHRVVRADKAFAAEETCPVGP